MTVHGPDELERERKLVLAETRASLMSDTKWRKLILALHEGGLSELQYVFKFVGSPIEHALPLPTGLHVPTPWVDGFDWGPTPLRAIEWMLLPSAAEYRLADRTIPLKRVSQDIEEAARIVAGLGQYPVERVDRGLLIRGYLLALTAG